MNRLEEAKAIIKTYIPLADCGIFNTRNIVGDPTETIYRKDGVTIDICVRYSYFEVFGLSRKEYDELKAYYKEVNELLSKGGK